MNKPFIEDVHWSNSPGELVLYWGVTELIRIEYGDWDQGRYKDTYRARYINGEYCTYHPSAKDAVLKSPQLLKKVFGGALVALTSVDEIDWK